MSYSLPKQFTAKVLKPGIFLTIQEHKFERYYSGVALSREREILSPRFYGSAKEIKSQADSWLAEGDYPTEFLKSQLEK